MRKILNPKLTAAFSHKSCSRQILISLFVADCTRITHILGMLCTRGECVFHNAKHSAACAICQSITYLAVQSCLEIQPDLDSKPGMTATVQQLYASPLSNATLSFPKGGIFGGIHLQATLRVAANVRHCHNAVVIVLQIWVTSVMTLLLLCCRSGLLGSRTGDSSVLLAAVPHTAGLHPLPQGTNLQCSCACNICVQHARTLIAHRAHMPP